MKKIILLFILCCTTLSSHAQLFEDFENGWVNYTGGAGTQGPGGPVPVGGPAGTTGWFIRNIVGSIAWSTPIAAYPAHAGVGAAYINREVLPGQLAEDWLVTPKVNNLSTTATLRFWSRLNGSGDTGSHYYIYMNDTPGSTQTTWADYHSIKDWTEAAINITQNTWEQKTVPIDINTNSTSAYFAFVMTNSSGDIWVIDDIAIANDCTIPNVSITDITTTSVNMHMSNTASASQWEVEIIPQNGTPTGTGTIVNGNSAIFTATTQGTAFTYSTTYKYYVRALCTSANKSPWSINTFTTAPYGAGCSTPIVIPPTLPYIDNSYINQSTDYYSYTPTVSGNIDVKLSSTENYRAVYIYDSCANIGGTPLAQDTNINTWEQKILNFPVQSGHTYYIVCSGKTSLANNILSVTRSQPTQAIAATFTTQSNCAQSPNTITIQANITNLGGTSLTAKIYIKGEVVATQTVNTTGIQTFGPFYIPFNPLRVVLQSANDAIVSKNLYTPCSPVNDDSCYMYDYGIYLPLNTIELDYLDVKEFYLNTATPSPEPTTCAGSADDDVWFLFTAGSDRQVISIQDRNYTSNLNISHEVYAGNCYTAMTPLYCSDKFSSVAENLSPGMDYAIRVFSTDSAKHENKLHIGTIPVTGIPFSPQCGQPKQLLINLINHLIAVQGSLSQNTPYTCAELQALAPYISVPNPKIYNFINPFNFSFSNHTGTNDIYSNAYNGHSANQYISDLYFLNYTGPSAEASFYTTLDKGMVFYGDVKWQSFIKYVNLCPDTPLPCNEVDGFIRSNVGETCVIKDAFTSFSFASTANIASYEWFIYDAYWAPVVHATTPSVIYNFPLAMNYFVKLVITTTDGCTKTFNKIILPAATCPLCVDSNTQTPNVKHLFLNLANYVINRYPDNPIPNGTSCPELYALGPYIMETQPHLNNVSYNPTTKDISFRFGTTGSQDVTIRGTGPLTDITLDNYSIPSIAFNATSMYQDGNVIGPQVTSIKKINFCPTPSNCGTVPGNIIPATGQTCIVVNSPTEFQLELSNSNVAISSYSWWVEDIAGVNHFTSTAAKPTFTLPTAGNYIVAVSIVYGDGCIVNYSNVFTADATCTMCTETNPQSPVVKQLFINLINHLYGIILAGGTIPYPYECAELDALAPYITVENPKIWRLDTGSLMFSFTENEFPYDVNTVGPLVDINLAQYNPENINVPQPFYQSSLYGPNGGTTWADQYRCLIKHINFCPNSECTPLAGGIQLQDGQSCVQTGATKIYSFLGDTQNIPNNGYKWTFYDANIGSTPLLTTTLASPPYAYAQPGNYTIKLEITELSGCTTTFFKDVVVAANCNACTETNPDSPAVKGAFITMLNSMLSLNTAPANGTQNMYVTALAPYITDAAPKIYNAVYTSTTISFSFSAGDSQPDIVLPRNGTITDINIMSFTDAAATATFGVTYANGTHANLTVKHVNFCPALEPCKSHVAFVFDESGSIDNDDTSRIKDQMLRFIDQQENSNMTVSFTGMADSDDYNRTDHVYGKITTQNKQLFVNFIAQYKSGYNNSGRPGVSANSDYWASGLSQALNYELIPDVVIVLTDGSQTNNVQTLKNVIAQVNTQSHLYVYGTESGSYVDGNTPTYDPNDVGSTQPIPNVTLGLMKSLKYLMNMAPSEFPLYSKTDFEGSSYFGYPDFSEFYDHGNESFFSDKLALAGIGCGGEPQIYCKDCETFKPSPTKEYWVSGWIKEEQNIQVKNYTSGIIRLIFQNGDGPDSVGLGNLEFMPSGEIIDGWQRVAAKFTVPQYATIMKIELENISPSIPVYFDDIRIHPIDGSMKSFVYDPVTFKLMAELDDNNYSTFYEYDKEGGLVRIKKETSRGIQTIQESRSGNVIQTGN